MTRGSLHQIQGVSGVYTSRFLNTYYLKLALRARKVPGAFEKRAPWAQLLHIVKPRNDFLHSLHQIDQLPTATGTSSHR